MTLVSLLRPEVRRLVTMQVKKVKVSAKEVGGSLSAAEVSTTLASLEQTYKAQDAAQVCTQLQHSGREGMGTQLSLQARCSALNIQGQLRP